MLNNPEWTILGPWELIAQYSTVIVTALAILVFALRWPRFLGRR